jgi:hypothetical protein
MTVMVATELPWAPVAEHSVERIMDVADRVWQGESVRLIAHVPSVTSYWTPPASVDSQPGGKAVYQEEQSYGQGPPEVLGCV